jgi:hypothetical protein
MKSLNYISIVIFVTINKSYVKIIMSSKSKISKSIKDIVSILIQNNFIPMTLKDIAKKMADLGSETEPTAINQRIIRDQGEYFISGGEKPKKIGLNINKPEIHFIRYRNQCQICGKTFPQEKLGTRDVNRTDHSVPKPWARRIACCQICMATSWEDSKLLQKAVPKEPDKAQQGETDQADHLRWEYLHVEIRQNFASGRYHYEFKEPQDEEWQYLVDDDGEISSFDITDIFDDYGDDGWELVQMHPIDKNKGFSSTPLPPLFAFNVVSLEEYDCIFKRQVTGD